MTQFLVGVRLAAGTCICAVHAIPAQTVRVTVLDATSVEPVPGAIVSLKRGDGTRVTAALSDERGVANLRGPVGESVRASAERIGYQEGMSQVFTITVEGVVVEIRLAPRDIKLETVDVRASATSCNAMGAQGSSAAALWDEVRKALTAAAMSGRPTGGVSAWQYDRTLNPSLAVLDESTTRASAGAYGFVTAPAEQLSREGFVRNVDGTTMYFAPDARLLISDEFVRDHCFGLRAPSAGGPLVGLTFAPAPGRRVTDVRGVLWVEAESGAPRELEYSYTGGDRSAPGEVAAGRMQFTALPNGQWVVERWWIRIPRLATIRAQRTRFGDTGARDTLLGYREEGGWLALEERQGVAPAIQLSGLIYDSAASRPLVNARVVLAGGAAIALTDSAGRYRLQTQLPGQYAVTVLHPRLADLGLQEQSNFATLSAGATNRFDGGVPGAALLRRHLCGQESDTARTRAIVVRVTDTATGEPISGANVWVARRTAALQRRGRLALAASSDSSLQTESDVRGVGVFCGIMSGDDVEVGAAFGGGEVERSLDAGERGGVQEVTLAIESRAPRSEPRRLRVVARAGDSTRALAGVEIHVPALNKSWYTGVDGRVDLAALGDRASALLVRSIGYLPRIVQWADGGIQGVSGDLIMERSVTTLAEVSVTASAYESRRMRDFEERRARGSGFFMARAELARREASPLSSALASVGSMRTERYRDGRVFLTSTRSRAAGGEACYPQIYLDGIRVWSAGDLGPQGDGRPPSIESFAVIGLEAIEVYDGLATTPIQYTGRGASCGTVLLWSRES